MRLIALNLMIVFTLLIGTVCAQSDSLSDCKYPNVCYTVNQDKRCLEMFEINLDLNILVDQQNQMLGSCFYKNEELTEEAKTKDVKIKKKNKDIIKIGIIATLTTIIAIIK